MRNEAAKRGLSNLIFALFLVILTFSSAFSQPIIGQSSIITLAFPWGARAAALGETFTGIADDEQALFYNPAGLGLSPLAKTWKHYSPSEEGHRFIALSGGMRNQRDVWALNAQNEIFRFNGVDWVNYSVHNVDTSETIAMIVEKYTSFDNRQKLDEAALNIKKFNNLYPRERRRVSAVLSQKMTTRQADSLAQFFAYLPFSERSRSNIKSYLLEFYELSEVDEAVEKIVAILDRISGLSGIFDLKIPYTIALSGKINDIECDATGRLWVAGDSGLWRFDSEWKKFASYDGIPNNLRFNSVSAMFGGDVAIATSAGAYLFENGIFRKITGESELFDGNINFAGRMDNNTYLGTDNGLLIISGGTEILIDSTRLVSNVVRAVAVDGRRRIWVGGDEGVSLFNGLEWQKFRFTNSRVYDIAVESNNRVWFATNNGAVEYVEARDGSPEWKVHHERNNLTSSAINSVIFHRNDIWLATDNGINRFQNGQVRATIFFENLLPSLHLDDMWHAAVAGIIPLGEWGTMGVFVNQLYFGEIEAWNPDGTSGGAMSAFEIVAGVGYGMRLRKDFAVGVNLKYFYSRLRKEDAEVQSFAVDAGLLKQNFINPNMSLGFSLLNMGPAVQYSEDTDKDPIPFTMRLGTSFKPVRRSTHYLLLALDLDREFVYVDEKGVPAPFIQAIWKDLHRDEETAKDKMSKVIVHTGLEFSYLDFIAPRIGWMYDRAGHRNEVNVGMGLKINMVAADFGIIFALGDNDVRQSQVRFSLTYVR